MKIPTIYSVGDRMNFQVRLLMLALFLGGCGGDAGPMGPQGAEGPEGPQGPVGSFPVATTVELTPASVSLYGGNTVLTATVRAQDGSVMPGVAPRFELSGSGQMMRQVGRTIDPSQVIAEPQPFGFAPAWVTVTASVGSAADTSSVGCCGAFFSVRSGTTINPVGTPGIFDTGPDEAFLEFPLGFPSGTSTWTLEVDVRDFIFGSNDPPIDFSVATYAANGSASTSDYGSGVLLTTLTIQPGTNQSYSLDVTPIVTSLIGSATHLGVRFYGSTLGQLSVQSSATLEGS